MGIEEEAFKDRDYVLAEMKKCSQAAGVALILSLLFVVVGVIADLIDETLGLETMNWFLLAIFAALLSVPPEIHVVAAKHLLGTEIVKK